MSRAPFSVEQDNMRTIKYSLFNRLTAQAVEADHLGLDKSADGLTDQLGKYASAVRKNDEFYSYNEDDFEKDLNHQLWGCVVRIADFYDIQQFDAEKLQEVLDRMAEGLIAEMCEQAGVRHGVGAYEDDVPGETHARTAIEVEDEEDEQEEDLAEDLDEDLEEDGMPEEDLTPLKSSLRKDKLSLPGEDEDLEDEDEEDEEDEEEDEDEDEDV